MKIIFAQGNPGAEYASTRHNVGFFVVDTYAKQLGIEFVSKPKFFADIAEFTREGEKILLVKPTTFYNETGRSARAILDFYKADAQTDMLVVHDDLALPFGTLRIRDKGSDAGNNGIKSINSHVGPKYHRLRTGIYNELRERMNDADFVLARFSKSEQETLEAHIIPKAIEVIDQFIADTHTLTSHNPLPLA